jgi:cytochrome c oxidase assembly protein subunit 15
MTLLFCGLSVAVLRRADTPRATRRLLAVAAALLGSQIVLGGLTVWKLLAAWTVTSHLITGNAFAATLLLTARSLREPAVDRASVPAIPSGARGWISVMAALLLLQLALGGLVSSRFAGLACPEWPTCNGGLWFPSFQGTVGLHLLHRMNGYLLVAALAIATVVCRRCPSMRAGTSLACALGLLQVLVGIANVRNAIPPEITGLHTGLATVLVLTVALLMRTAWRRPPDVVAARSAVLNPG